MASTDIVDYLGIGRLGNRPATPNVGTAALALWYSVDVLRLDMWNGGMWVPASPMQSVAGRTGVIVLSSADIPDLTINLQVPVWTSATRPAGPNLGKFGYSTDIETLDVWDGSQWILIPPVALDGGSF